MIERITDRVFLMPPSDETDRPSLGLICGDKYSLIVDSGNSPNHAKEFLSEISKMNIAPIKYLLITHWHWDHVFGINEMNLITIAHENTDIKLKEMRGYKWDDKALDELVRDGVYNNSTVENIKKEITDRKNFTVGDLHMTYSDRLEIDLGGVKCIVKAVGGDHTDDSSIVFVPEEKVMFLGDCVYGRTYNGEYGYTHDRLFPMIDKIEEFEAEHFVISHEELYSKDGINEFWDQLRNAGKAVGMDTSLEEATKRFLDMQKRVPSEDEAFYIKCFANVNRVAR